MKRIAVERFMAGRMVEMNGEVRPLQLTAVART